MKEGNTKASDKNMLQFFSLINHNTISIPKNKVRTWQDLLIELERQTGVQGNKIDIAINSQKIYYEPKVKLVDIGFRTTDKLYVLTKPTHSNQKTQENYDKKVQKQKQRCMKSLKMKNEHEEIIRMISLIESNPEYQELYDELVHQYGKVQTMIAIEKFEGNRKGALTFLKSPQATQLAEKIQKEGEREYLKSFMAQAEIAEIKQFIRKNNLSQEAYRGIVLKLYQKYPKFRQYEPRHQKYVQQELFGKVIDSDSEQPQQLLDNSNPYASIVEEILSKVQASKKPQRLSNQQKQAFMKKMRKEADDKKIEAALAQANNNLPQAQEIVKGGLVPELQNLVNVCYRTSRINIVVQFFNQPEFAKIKQSLRNNPKKAQKFVDWVISENKDKSLLVSLIKKYKDYAVTVLSEQFCIQKPQKLQNKVVKHKAQLQSAKQIKLKEEVQKVCDQQLVAALIKAKIEPKLAAYAVRAAKNDPSLLQKYLQLGTDYQLYDFCPKGSENEQLYLFKRLKKEKQLIIKLRNKDEWLLWLGQLSVLRPKLYEMAVINKPFMDWMIHCMQL